MNSIIVIRKISQIVLVFTGIITTIIYISFFTELKNPKNSNKTIEETSLLRKSLFMLVGTVLIAICGLIELITR